MVTTREKRKIFIKFSTACGSLHQKSNIDIYIFIISRKNVLITHAYLIIKLHIDECSQGLHNCSSNSQCIDTGISFSCICNYGYTGNGVICNGRCYSGCHIIVAKAYI